MMGEFYARTLVGTDRLMRAERNARRRWQEQRTRKDGGDGEDANRNAGDKDDDKDVQFLVHLAYKNNQLLDRHRLMIDGICRNGAAKDRTETAKLLRFWGHGECYEKLVFCGYKTFVQYTTEPSPRLTMLKPSILAARSDSFRYPVKADAEPEPLLSITHTNALLYASL